MIQTIRVHNSVAPFGFLSEFRPNSLENWTESIEGDTTVDVVVSEAVYRDIAENYDGSFSLIISMMNDQQIRHEYDFNVDDGSQTKAHKFTYIYDSYYIREIVQIENSRNYRLVCVGMKEYLAYRLAIPNALNATDGTISVPDGSQEAKPIPTSQYLRYTGMSWKGIVRGLIYNAKVLQDMPLDMTDLYLGGTRERTYLLKDMRSLKESFNNMTDDIDGPDFVFDGGFGERDKVQFFARAETNLYRGDQITLSTRNAEIFRPRIEISQNEATNNVWAVGNASDGNILLAHKVQPDTSGKVLLQRANTERNDIQTPQFLLDYTLGILQRSGQAIRTMELESGNTPKMFLALVGGFIYIKAPEHPDIDLTFWRIISRDIKRTTIVFDLIEVVIDNDGNGIPDRLE